MQTKALPRTLFLIVAPMTAIGFHYACSDSGSGLPATDAGIDAAGGTGGTGGQGGTGAGGAGAAGGSGGSAGSGGTGGSAGSGGVGGSGGTGGRPGLDGGADLRLDTPRDLPEGELMPTSPGTVECGAGATCMTATQICCVTSSGGMPTPMCVDKTATCMGSPIECDGTNDCATGQVCCAELGGSRTAATCTNPASCSGGGRAVRCNDATDCPMAAPMCCTYMGGGVDSQHL